MLCRGSAACLFIDTDTHEAHLSSRRPNSSSAISRSAGSVAATMECTSIMNTNNTSTSHNKPTYAEVAGIPHCGSITNDMPPKTLFKDWPLTGTHGKVSDPEIPKLWSPQTRAHRKAQFQTSLDLLETEYQARTSAFEADFSWCRLGYGELDPNDWTEGDSVLGCAEWCNDCWEYMYGVEPYQAKKASWIEAWIEGVDARD